LPRFLGYGWRVRPLGLPDVHDGEWLVAGTIDISAEALAGIRRFHGLEERSALVRLGPSFVRGVMSQPSREEAPDDDPPSARDIALGILLELESLPQLMELHYYAGEPGFVDIIRMLIGLPEEERELLRDFLTTSAYRLRIRREGARLVIDVVPR